MTISDPVFGVFGLEAADPFLAGIPAIKIPNFAFTVLGVFGGNGQEPEPRIRQLVAISTTGFTDENAINELTSFHCSEIDDLI